MKMAFTIGFGGKFLDKNRFCKEALRFIRRDARLASMTLGAVVRGRLGVVDRRRGRNDAPWLGGANASLSAPARRFPPGVGVRRASLFGSRHGRDADGRRPAGFGRFRVTFFVKPIVTPLRFP